VEIDHGGADIFVAEEMLDGKEADALFEQMGGKRMSQGVDRRLFIYPGFFFASMNTR
jgi:hypothetical protein